MMDLSYLTSRIRQNQEASLRVVLSPRLSSAVLAELIAALQVNESVTHVQLLCCGSFVQTAAPSLWNSLLGAVLGLPNLKSFQMGGCSTATSYNDDDCSIPIQAFASIRTSSLAFFSLSRLVLCGGPTDLQCLSSALREQKALQEFQLISCGLVDLQQTPQDTSALEPLLKTLAALPQLENLEVSGTFTPLGVLEQASRALFQSRSLKRLSISDFIFPEAALASIWEEHLSKNFSLQELAISGNLTRQGASQLAHVLKRNKTLQAIALRVDNFDDEACNQELARAIGASRLRVVSLCSFFGKAFSTASRNAFSKRLETNCSLEYLYVPCPLTDLVFWNNVRLYCGLNSSGRKRVKKQDDTITRSEISRSFLAIASKNASGSPLTPKSSKATVSLADVMISPSKRHQKMVAEARSAKRRKFRAVVPTQGLSSMFIR